MKRGFTLLELLTVVVIIAILAGLLLPAVMRARRHARKIEVRNMVASIARALENFKIDYNQYPWEPPPSSPQRPESSDVIKELAPNDTRLEGDSGEIEWNKRMKDYLPDLPDKHIDLTQKKLVDIWGEQYRFWWDGPSEKAVVYSVGEDGEDDTYTDGGDTNYGDDINNL